MGLASSYSANPILSDVILVGQLTKQVFFVFIYEFVLINRLGNPFGWGKLMQFKLFCAILLI